MRLLSRLYRACIRLQPAEHRALYGDEQWRLFEEVVAEEAPENRIRRLAWSLRLIACAMWAAIQVHLDQRPSRNPFGMRGGGSMGSDLRFTMRSMKTAPWYAAALITVTAVTVALATTAFSVVDGVLFRPVPYPESERLVSIEPGFATVPPPVYRDQLRFLGYGSSEVDVANWQASVPELAVTAFRVQPWSGLVDRPGEQVLTGVGTVQANFFDVIGVAPLIGGFKAEDFLSEGKMRPAVITHDVWMTRFDGGRDAIGHEIVTYQPTGSGFRIVGVMPKGFTFPSSRWDVTFIVPFVTDPKDRLNPAARRLGEVIARLPDGMTPAGVRERLMRGVTATAAAFPPRGPKPEGWSDNGWRREGPYDTVSVTPLSESLGRHSRPMFLAVFAAVALLAVIASANVGSLMSARALERQREIEVRRALGAGAWAVGRLWTIEAAALIGAGSLIGAAATPLLLGIMLQLLPEEVVLLKPAALDLRVAGFVAATLVLMVMVVVMAPIKRSLALAGAQSRGASERVRTPGRFMIIGTQVSVAFVLTVAGACLVGSLMTVYSKHQPIRTDGVVALDVMLQGDTGASAERAQRESTIRSRLAQVPGAIAVTTTSAQVLKGGGALPEFEAPTGRKSLANQDMWGVTEGFYDVLALHVVEGRLPSADELRRSAPLLVISERVAQNYWPDRSALGQTLKHWPSKGMFTVIGVVRDVRWLAWDLESPIIYAPYATTARYPWMTYFIRTDANSGRLVQDAIKAVGEVDRLAQAQRAGTLDSVFRESVALRRFQSWLFGGFAAAGLVVVGVGIFGLLAMSTARRTKEVGIRCALGATPNSVAGLVIREQAIAVIAGLAAGGAVAAWAVGFVKGYLYEITVTDPRIWLSAVALILLTALLGSLVPAWRASRIDPLEALRIE